MQLGRMLAALLFLALAGGGSFFTDDQGFRDYLNGTYAGRTAR